MGKFHATNLIDQTGLKAEKLVWKAIQNDFQSRHCYGYLHYPIFAESMGRKEIDILLLDQQLGITFIEVKGIKINQIKSINGHVWTTEDFVSPDVYPYKQAENQMFALFDYIKKQDSKLYNITKRIFVALPYITEAEWRSREFHLLPSCPPIIFKDDLISGNLLKKIKSQTIYSGKRLSIKETQILLKLIGGGDEVEVRSSSTKSLKRIEIDETTKSPKHSVIYVTSTKEHLKDDVPQLLNLLKKGIKVFLFSKFNYQLDKKFEPFNKGLLFEYKGTINYTLDEPYILIDGVGFDKKHPIFSKFPKFNSGQFIIEHTPLDRSLAITAGAGTGKTHTMIQRIMYLLNMEDDLHPKEITMITFTRKSAQEMKHKLKEELLKRYEMTRNPRYFSFAEDLKDMPISTIHSFAKSLISELGFVLGYGKNVRLKSYVQVRRTVLEQIVDSYMKDQDVNGNIIVDFRHYELIELLERYWGEMEKKGLTVNEIKNLDWGKSSKERGEPLKRLFEYIFVHAETKLNELKQHENAITMGDLVRKLSEITIEETVLMELNQRIRYLFIDEFQDSDDVQIQLVAKIQRIINAKLFVVGDVKQSIYRFRGADYTAFDQLKEQTQQDFIEEPLTVNYRTSGSLIEEMGTYFTKWGTKKHLTYTSNDVLKSYEPTTFPNNEFNIIDYKGYNFKKDVIKQVKKAIKEVQQQLKTGEKDLKPKKTNIALLVRTNKQAFELKQLADEAGIHVKVNVGGTFFNTSAVKDFASLIKGLLYPKNPEALLNLVNSPFIKDKVYSYELISLNGEEDKILDMLKKKTSIKHFLEETVPYLRTMPLYAVIQSMIKNSVYQNLYSKLSWQYKSMGIKKDIESIKEEVYQYRKNLEYLMEMLHQQFDSTTASLYSIHKWLEVSIKTNRNVDEPMLPIKISADDVEVEIVTVHKSKGLEYHTVIVPYTKLPFEFPRDTLIIHKDKNSNRREACWYVKKEEIQNDHYIDIGGNESVEITKEETRLLYVAMTRSRERLVIMVPEKPGRKTWAHLLMK